MKGRPRIVEGTVLKGTCCLVHKLHPGPGRIAAAACTTCPLRHGR